jgi:tRNA 2-thiouridine synthesizing protein A
MVAFTAWWLMNPQDPSRLNGAPASIQPDVELDLRGVICPYNFVKTKLKLETMEGGQVLSVLLDDGDPIRNVPQSVRNEGHTILSQERVDCAHRVIIRKGVAG